MRERKCERQESVCESVREDRIRVKVVCDSV